MYSVHMFFLFFLRIKGTCCVLRRVSEKTVVCDGEKIKGPTLDRQTTLLFPPRLLTSVSLITSTPTLLGPLQVEVPTSTT